jgi:hypothetical protein
VLGAVAGAEQRPERVRGGGAETGLAVPEAQGCSRERRAQPDHVAAAALIGMGVQQVLRPGPRGRRELMLLG